MRKPLIILVSLLCVSARAQDPAGPCRPDIERYCSQVTPGGGRIIACLKAHEDKLSEGCRDRGVALRRRLLGTVQACFRDFLSLCSTVTPGEGRILQCLLDNQDSLSGQCSERMSEIRLARSVVPSTVKPEPADGSTSQPPESDEEE